MTKFLTQIALKHRKTVYLTTLTITLIFMGILSQLRMDTDWKEMLPKKNEVVKNYVQISENFTDITQLIIAVSGDDSNAMKKTADEIAAKLKTITRKKRQ